VKEAATQEAWSATPGEGCLRPAQKALVKEVAEKAGESVAQFVTPPPRWNGVSDSRRSDLPPA
jgi:hypothetical protein